MVESIAFALLLKKFQIGMIGVGIVVAAVLTVYNLPWDKDGKEWETLVETIRKLKTIQVRTLLKTKSVKTKWVDQNIGSATEVECSS